ncbi:Uncharacterised protein [Mycobacterium tuberculosis]|nr:Uncharacterised protein [Mycobacterium tuberculosis]
MCPSPRRRAIVSPVTPTPSSATSKTHFSSVIPSLTEAVVAPECRTTLDSSSRTTPKTMGSIPLRIG